jgi:hypothetical protein
VPSKVFAAALESIVKAVFCMASLKNCSSGGLASAASTQEAMKRKK